MINTVYKNQLKVSQYDDYQNQSMTNLRCRMDYLKAMYLTHGEKSE